MRSNYKKNGTEMKHGKVSTLSTASATFPVDG